MFSFFFLSFFLFSSLSHYLNWSGWRGPVGFRRMEINAGNLKFGSSHGHSYLLTTNVLVNSRMITFEPKGAIQ